MALPPAVRKDVALRLLESLEIADQESVDEAWGREIGSRVDDLVEGDVQTIPGEQVFADIAARRSTRHA
jgi:putative addiction module component (TIGR02574 family)